MAKVHGSPTEVSKEENALVIVVCEVAQRVLQACIQAGVSPRELLNKLSSRGAQFTVLLKGAIKRFMFCIHPHFAESLRDWSVAEDHGALLSDDWNPTEFFEGLQLTCVHKRNEVCLFGEELVRRIRAKMSGRREFDQHILAWLIENWDDSRIPSWFIEQVKSDDVCVVATGTILLNPDGVQYMLHLYYHDDRPCWGSNVLSYGFGNRSYRGLISSGS